MMALMSIWHQDIRAVSTGGLPGGADVLFALELPCVTCAACGMGPGQLEWSALGV